MWTVQTRNAKFRYSIRGCAAALNITGGGLVSSNSYVTIEYADAIVFGCRFKTSCRYRTGNK